MKSVELTVTIAPQALDLGKEVGVVHAAGENCHLMAAFECRLDDMTSEKDRSPDDQNRLALTHPFSFLYPRVCRRLLERLRVGRGRDSSAPPPRPSPGFRVDEGGGTLPFGRCRPTGLWCCPTPRRKNRRPPIIL